MEIIPTVVCHKEGSHGLFLNWKVQARLSEIQEALKETKAVQEMKEQVLLLIHLLQTLFISFKPHSSSSHERDFFQATGLGHYNLGKFNFSARTNTKDYG